MKEETRINECEAFGWFESQMKTPLWAWQLLWQHFSCRTTTHGGHSGLSVSLFVSHVEMYRVLEGRLIIWVQGWWPLPTKRWIKVFAHWRLSVCAVVFIHPLHWSLTTLCHQKKREKKRGKLTLTAIRPFDLIITHKSLKTHHSWIKQI